MGSNAVQEKNNIEFLKGFNFVNNSPNIDGCRIYFDPLKNEKLFLFEVQCQTENQYQEILNRILSRSFSSHKNFLELKKFQTQVDQWLCSKAYIVTYFMECVEETLNTYLDNKINQKTNNQLLNPFIEEEILWNFIESMINSLYQLESINEYHGDLQFENIFYIPVGNQRFEIKIAQPELIKGLKFFGLVSQNNEFSNQSLPKGSFKFQPPQLLFLLRKRQTMNSEQFQKLQQSINLNQCDVYSLGVICLCLATLSYCDEIVDHDTLFLSENFIADKLQEVRSKYSLRLYQLLQNMLNLQSSVRPNFTELSEYLQIQDTIPSRITFGILNSRCEPDFQVPYKDLTNSNQYEKTNYMALSGIGGSLYNRANMSFNGELGNSKEDTSLQNNILHSSQSRVDLEGEQDGTENNIIQMTNTNFFEEYSFIFTTTPCPKQNNILVSSQKVNSYLANLRGSLFLIKQDQSEDEYSVMRAENTFKSLLNSQISINNRESHKNYNSNSLMLSQRYSVGGEEATPKGNGKLMFENKDHSVAEKQNSILQKTLQSSRAKEQKQTNYSADIAQKVEQSLVTGNACIILEPNGCRYEGQIKDKLKHGFGKLYKQDGEIYIGEWKNDQRSGKGKLLQNKDQTVYEGSWLEDQFNGNGVLYNDKFEIDEKKTLNFNDFNDGINKFVQYEGEFSNSQKQGYGKIYFKSGDFYEGLFFNDNIDGEGIYQSPKGTKIQGQWRKGVLVFLKQQISVSK